METPLQPHLDQPDQSFDADHATRFLDLVRKALVTPPTEAIKKAEREYNAAHANPAASAPKH